MSERRKEANMRVGVVGLGIMGREIARNLATAGHSIAGYDTDPARLDDVAKFGVQAAESAAELAQRMDVIIVSLPSATALMGTAEDVAGAKCRGLILLECSTLDLTSKQKAREALSESGAVLLDCPLSGTGSQAVSGDLVVFGSGDKASFDTALPVMRAFSKRQQYVGDFGNGTKVKLIANTLIATHIAAAAEALTFAARAELDLGEVHLALSGSPAGSSMFDVRGAMMVKGEMLPAQMTQRLFQKDLNLIAEFADAVGAKLPLFDAARPHYDKAAAQLPETDTASIFDLIREESEH